ncbi:MAG TPA: phosphatase PAP2 family protein [bacterium]|nr:phosphatase PAP2 family protein [bacterium]
MKLLLLILSVGFGGGLLRADGPAPAAPVTGAAMPAALSPVAGALALSAGASAPAAPVQSFGLGTLRLLEAYPLAPLHWDGEDWLWATGAGAAIVVTWNNDLPLYRALATGPARKDWLDHSMPAVSALGDGLMEMGAVAVAGELGGPRLARTSAVAEQSLCVVALYAEVFKFAAWSNRPYQDDTQHKLWYFSQSTQGMPSGHTFSAFAVAEVYGGEYGRWWTYPVACLIAYSRVYNQAHWPSDVVAGAALGIAAGVQARHQAEALGAPSLRFGLAPSPSGQTPLVVAHVPF